MSVPWWLREWRISLQCRGPRFNPWVGEIPWSLATHSSSLAWRIPWTAELGGLHSIGWPRVVGHDWATNTFTVLCNGLCQKRILKKKEYIYICVCVCAHTCVYVCLVVQLCPTLCNPLNCSVSSVHGLFWLRILKRVVISSSTGPSQPRD